MSPPECVTVLSGELGTVYLSPSNVSNLFACLKFLVETWSSEEGAVVVACRNTPDQIYWGSLTNAYLFSLSHLSVLSRDCILVTQLQLQSFFNK